MTFHVPPAPPALRLRLAPRIRPHKPAKNPPTEADNASPSLRAVKIPTVASAFKQGPQNREAAPRPPSALSFACYQDSSVPSSSTVLKDGRSSGIPLYVFRMTCAFLYLSCLSGSPSQGSMPTAGTLVLDRSFGAGGSFLGP